MHTEIDADKYAKIFLRLNQKKLLYATRLSQNSEVYAPSQKNLMMHRISKLWHLNIKHGMHKGYHYKKRIIKIAMNNRFHCFTAKWFCFISNRIKSKIPVKFLTLKSIIINIFDILVCSNSDQNMNVPSLVSTAINYNIYTNII